MATYDPKDSGTKNATDPDDSDIKEASDLGRETIANLNREFDGEEEKSSTSSNMFDNISVQTTFELNGIRFVPKKGRGRNKKTLLHPKAKRKSQTEEQRMKLIESIQSKQQATLFHAITISVNDPEKMTNTYSLANIMAENQRNLAKYDLLDVFTIIYPKKGCFEEYHPQEGELELDPLHGGLKTKKLFEDYLRITPEEVAESSKYYSLYVPEDQRTQEDLDWSLAYYEKNVKPELYSKVYGVMLRYEPDAQGGPLFLKLLLDRVTTSGESTLKAMLNTLKTYSIKTSCAGEDVDKVAGIFSSIIDNIDALSNGELPTDTVDSLLNLFQTTSVPVFNSKFKKLQEDLADAEINSEIDPNYRLRVNNTTSLGNTLHSARYVLTYAERTYRRLVKGGEWDACLQKVPGKAGFIAQQPRQFSHDEDKNANNRSKSNNNTCFNCGEVGCRLETCPHPRDEERIAANKAKHPTFIRLKKQREKWRAPEPRENNKRVIEGTPYTWNPKGGKFGRGRWIPDDTPHDGQPNDGGPPQVHFTNSDISAGEMSSLTGQTRTQEERRLYLHMVIQNAQKEISSL